MPCYGHALSGDAYGPWHDPDRFEARLTQSMVWSYMSDLPTIPTRMLLGVKGLRSDGFIDLHTRQFSVSLTLWNNALPTLCFVRIDIKVSTTGHFSQLIVVDSMNVAEYTGGLWWVEVLLEVGVLLMMGVQVVRELREIASLTQSRGLRGGIGRYFQNPFNIIDWLSTALLLMCTMTWLLIVTDQTRDVDLNATHFVDLGPISRRLSEHTLIYSLYIITRLLSLLQVTSHSPTAACRSRSSLPLSRSRGPAASPRVSVSGSRFMSHDTLTSYWARGRP